MFATLSCTTKVYREHYLHGRYANNFLASAVNCQCIHFAGGFVNPVSKNMRILTVTETMAAYERRERAEPMLQEAQNGLFTRMCGYVECM